MSVTPQTNTTLEEIAELLLKEQSFCICGHINPDGDAIGSGLTLKCALDSLGKDVCMLLADDAAELDEKFLFLPGATSYIRAKACRKIPDVFICVDTPSAERLGESASKIHSKAKLTVTIDHHAYKQRFSDLSYTDPDAASTSLIVWQLVRLMQVGISPDIATCALSGLMTDTGSFQYQNVDANAFALASEMVGFGASPNKISSNLFQRKTLASIELESKTIENMQLFHDGMAAISWITLKDMSDIGAKKSDTDTLINILRSIDGVRVACILKEDETTIRGSLRSKDDTDVSLIAERFGGGGHKGAAGFTLHGTLKDGIERLRACIDSLLDGEPIR